MNSSKSENSEKKNNQINNKNGGRKNLMIKLEIEKK